MKKVCLDPGHVKGYNVGYKKSYAEGTAMFNYAYKLKRLLEACGIDVVVTRDKVEDNPSLTARGSKAKGCDLFVSLHSNGVDDYRAYGVSTFYSIKRDGDKKAAQNWCDRLAKLINNGTRSRGATTRKGGGDWDYYTVVQYAVKANCPHVFLIEHGFHSNPDECEWLLNDSNLDKMARLERDIICEILGVESAGANNDNKAIGAFCKLVNTPADTLNVRAEANYKSKKISELAHNSVVTVSCIASNGWCNIKQGDISGWVNGSYLSPVSNTTTHAKTSTPNDTLNMRVAPDYKSKKIGEIPDGTKVPVFLEANNGWILVQYNSTDGWVNGLYVKREDK